MTIDGQFRKPLATLPLAARNPLVPDWMRFAVSFAILAGLGWAGCATSGGLGSIKVVDPWTPQGDPLTAAICFEKAGAYDEAIDECGRLLDAGHLSEVDRARALLLLGKCHFQRGGRVGGGSASAETYRKDVEKAQRSLEQALTLASSLDNMARRDLAEIRNSLGLVYRQNYPLNPALDQFREAERLYDELTRSPQADADVAALAREHVTVLGNLVAVLLDAGKFTEARAACDKLRGLSSSQSDPYAHQTLGAAYHEFGELDRADQEFDLARTIVREGGVQDSEPGLLAKIMLSKAACANDAEEFRKAEGFLGESEEALQKTHGDARLEAAIRSNWGRLYLARTRLKEADQELKKALRIQVEHLGKEHPDALATQLELASLARTEGHFDESKERYSRAIAGLQHVLGVAHPTTATAQLDYAFTIGQADPNRCDEAVNKAEEALQVLDGSLGPLHPNAVYAALQVTDLAGTCGGGPPGPRFYGLFADARGRFRNLTYRDETSLLYARALVLFAEINSRDDRSFEEAKKLYEDAERVYRLIYSDQHLGVAQVRGGIAGLLHAMGRLQEAATVYRTALKDLNPELEWNPLRGDLLGGYCDVELALGEQEGARRDGQNGLRILRNSFEWDHPAVKTFSERHKRCLDQ